MDSAAEPAELGRREIAALFDVGERDSLRLLRQFGARKENDAYSIPRAAVAAQLEAVRADIDYRRYLEQTRGSAAALAQARQEHAARRVRVRHDPPRPMRLRDLPPSIRWRRESPAGPARFEILYDDGADLMRQLSEFVEAAALHRDEFYAGTEPADADPR